jgi:hypothetical protein
MIIHLRTINAIAAVLVLAACASPTTAVKPNPAASAALSQNPGCPHQDSGRVAANPTNCPGFDRSYSSDDITRTGATTTGDALRLLDPAVTVHH